MTRRAPRRAADPHRAAVTDARAAVIHRARETCFYIVADVIELAALLLGEVSPAIRQQAADLLEPTIEEMGGD